MQLMGVEVSGTSKFKNLKLLQYCMYLIFLLLILGVPCLKFCSLQLK